VNDTGTHGPGRSRKSVLVRTWLPAILYVCCILVLSQRPLPKLPPIKDVDKYLHVLLYGVLAVLILRGFRAGGYRHAGILSVAAALLVGLLDEGLQLWGGVRKADPYDLLADGSGAVLAVLAAFFTRALLHRTAVRTGTRQER